MTTKEYIKAWDGFTPLWLNVNTKEGITDTERLTSKKQYDSYFDSWEVGYITTDGNGEATICIYER